MIIAIPEKFSEQQIDKFVNDIYQNYKINPNDSYSFNFSKTQWISSQCIVVLTGLLKYFNTKGIQFELILFDENIDINNIEKRNALQIIGLWDIYEIWKIFPKEWALDNIDYYYPKIEYIKKLFGIKSLKPREYEKHDITPIISLNKINNYNDKDIEELLEQYYVLNTATQELLKNNNCEHPFVSKVMGSIISKELYENFLDHSEESYFNIPENFAFMCLTLKGKLDESKYDTVTIQKRLKDNFTNEALTESKSFFYNSRTNNFKNQSYVQYTFFDFGEGIVKTLKGQYLEINGIDNFVKEQENEVLKFAFKHDSSRYPIYDKFGTKDIYIPRGLFDVLCIVKRYEGLIVVRSNYGKVLYDFSDSKTIEEACSYFGDNTLFFPGTMISIYLPALKVGKSIDKSVIKPIFEQPDYSLAKKSHIILYEIIEKLNKAGKDLYSNLIKELCYVVNRHNQKQIIYFSFRGCDLDLRLTKKIIFFLLTNYDFNTLNNVIIVHPPQELILQRINEEIIELSTIVQNYKIHPLPFVFFTSNNDKESIKLIWLGVFNSEDKTKLNDLLFEQFSLAKSDFLEPDSVIGHINYFDRYGNLKSNLPNAKQIITFYKNEHSFFDDDIVSNRIENNQCLIRNKNDIFLCNGDYYQYEFLSLINLLENKTDCEIIVRILFDKLQKKIDNNKRYKYIGIATTSHKILDTLVNLNKIKDDDCIHLDNFHTSIIDKKLNNIEENIQCILVCDVLATGAKATELIKRIKEKKGEVVYIAVIASIIDPSFEYSEIFIREYSDRIICLYQHEIKKYRRSNPIVKNDLQNKQIVRINPYTNIPITISSNNTNINNIIIQNNDTFLNLIDDVHINIGFQIFNNVIHPYFFDTENILIKNGENILYEIFKYIHNLDTNNMKIFFPKNSGIKHINFDKFKYDILHDGSIEEIKLERFSTSEGWKFPHTTDYLAEKINGHDILILDDGSCSGDSIIQMINQISLFDPKQITVLCIIGRVSDYKKEFFSLISALKKDTRVKILFGTHWHIPTYYLDNNPNTNERDLLNKIIGLQNIPNRIKIIAEAVLKEIEPKEEGHYEDYKYFPKIRQSNNIIPKKDIIKIRDEIGKVTGYRYYKESFSYFDDFIKKYESKMKMENRYKDIELLCATITYEPYLFGKLKLILPDVIAKIKEFIEVLIFEKTLNIDKLFYNWDKKDLVHLFFIVYNDQEILEVLSSEVKLNSIINFIDNTVYSLDYFLYRLLFYFPLDIKDLKKLNGSDFHHLFDAIVQNNLLSIKAHNEIKIFHSLIASLPTKKDYYSFLSEIVEFYKNISDKEHHKSSLVSQVDVMIIDLEKMKKNLFENKDDFVKSWEQLSYFLGMLLSFAKSYPNFFVDKINDIEGKPKPDFFTEEDDKNLRFIYGKLNEMIYNISENSSFEKIKLYLNTIKINFLQSSSDFYKIFNNITTYNPEDIIYQYLKSKLLIEELDFQSNLDEKVILDFPLYFFKDIVFSEIINNLRHRDREEKIKFTYYFDGQYFCVKIRNNISNEKKTGGRSGMDILNKLNQFPNGIARYSKEEKGMIYVQILKIKRL